MILFVESKTKQKQSLLPPACCCPSLKSEESVQPTVDSGGVCMVLSSVCTMEICVFVDSLKNRGFVVAQQRFIVLKPAAYGAVVLVLKSLLSVKLKSLT